MAKIRRTNQLVSRLKANRMLAMAAPGADDSTRHIITSAYYHTSASSRPSASGVRDSSVIRTTVCIDACVDDCPIVIISVANSLYIISVYLSYGICNARLEERQPSTQIRTR